MATSGVRKYCNKETDICAVTLTTPTLWGSIACIAAVRITVVYFYFTFHLQCNNLMRYHGLKADDDGIFLQGVYEDP